MCGVRLHEAVALDARRIAGVHSRAWEVGYRGLVEDRLLYAMPKDELTIRWRAILTGHGGPMLTTLVASAIDGVALGFVSFGTESPFGDEVEHVGAAPAQGTVGSIVALYVDPLEWRRGIGRKLLAAALRRMVAGECTAVTLWVLDRNARALAFYNNMGFQLDGVKALHSPTRRRESRMRLDLSPQSAIVHRDFLGAP